MKVLGWRDGEDAGITGGGGVSHLSPTGGTDRLLLRQLRPESETNTAVN